MSEGPESRTAFLAERVAAAIEARTPTFPVPFRQKQIDLPRVEVPIDFPMYRLENGRTHRAQTRWIEQHGLTADFFADPENPEAQRAQGQILLEMADLGNLATDLGEKDQRDPIVLSPDGFIVNGNRRTAWLRDQGEKEYLPAVVLPADAEAADIYETEVELQMARETKAEYNWIDQALHVQLGVKKLYENRPPHKAIESIARRMNEPEKEVQAILERLALVDLYLEWLGHPGAYHLIGDDSTGFKQSFEDLHDRVRGKHFAALSPSQQQATRYACFAVIKQTGEYKDVRSVFNAMRSQPGQVVDRVRDELPEDLKPVMDERPSAESEDGAGTEADVDDLLDALGASDAPADAAPGSELLGLVETPEHVETVAPLILAVVADLEEEQKDAEKSLAPLKQAEKALRQLQAIDLGDSPENLDELARVLSEISVTAERLAEEVEVLQRGA